MINVLNRANRIERHKNNCKAFVYRSNGMRSVTPRVELLTVGMYEAYKAQNGAAVDRVTEIPAQLFEVVWFKPDSDQPNFDDWLDAEQAFYDDALADFEAGTGRM